MPEPNDAQRQIIDRTDGLYCVDAGPGTGKTFALTRRYAAVVDQPGVEPDDVWLVTFTDNAATELRERVVDRSSYGVRALRDAPIGTFHSRCHDVIDEHGFDAPRYLGFDERITSATQLLEDELVEAERFARFVDRFSDDHPEYDDVFRAVRDPTALLGLVKQLAAKGVFPTRTGWYRDGERHLDGDFEAFKARFEAANEPRNDGRKQSALRAALSRYGRDKCYRATAPTKAELRGDGKAVPASVAERAFEEDREALKRFVHDVYFGYLGFALGRDYLNFGFLQGFAYVLLCEDHRVRESLAADYVMVDEFQDTSEIQFKLALLLCGSDNLCVVGDWKQSIYSFQYAAVENITAFESRLSRFAADLNADRERVGLDPDGVEHVELTENYRSTQSLIDFAEHGLVVPATGRESVDEAAVRDRIVGLESTAERDGSRIEAVRHADEPAAVLTRIQAIVGNDDYLVVDGGEARAPTYGDVAVLTRTREFGRELLGVAGDHDLPMAYEGGIEVFRTDQAKLLLAWLRVLESDADRGWAVVLERAGYRLDAMRRILDRGAYPDDMLAFKAALAGLDGVGAVAERVCSRYGYDDVYADVVIDAVQSVHDDTTMTRGDLIRYLERAIDRGATGEVAAGEGTDAVTVQTIHAAKGLEHPIVVLANMNRHAFPRSGGGAGGTVTFDDPVGLRQRRVYATDHGSPHVYDNWRHAVLRACLPRGYDEERRLLYVAMSRAEHHLVFTAGETPNAFLEALPVEVEAIEPDVRPVGPRETVQTAFRPTVSPPAGPVQLSAHDLMDDAVFERTDEGLGKAFGREVHAFAEALVDGEDPTPGGTEPDWGHVAAFVDSLDGALRAEQPAVLPLVAGDQRVAVVGVVDLVAITPNRVSVADFKTDRTRVAEDEYRHQLSVYYHVLDAVYPDREVAASLYYTAEGEARPVEPVPMDALAERVGAELARRASTRP